MEKSKVTQEIKKMKQGMSYSCKEKTIILNVFKYFRTEHLDKCVTEIVRRTSKATGCSEKSIFQFRKEEASAGGFKEPSKIKIRKNVNINSRHVKYDNNVRQALRTIIYDLKYKNIVPSLSMILKHVKVNVQIPNFSIMTLRRLLFDMGFYYEKNGNKSVLVEKNGVVNKDNIPRKNGSKNVKNDEKFQVHPCNTQIQNNKITDVGTVNNQIIASNCSSFPIMNHYNTSSQYLVPIHMNHRNEDHGQIGHLETNHRSIVKRMVPPPLHLPPVSSQLEQTWILSHSDPEIIITEVTD